MKVFWGIVITLLVVAIVVLILMNKGYKQLFMAMGKNGSASPPPNFSSLTCGKNGNPPCTVEDLQKAGWTSEQIKTADEASKTIQQAFLCANFGIGC